MDIVHELNGILFTWDSDKGRANLEKHGVHFETACEAFFDPFLKVVAVDFEAGETRESLIGLTANWEMLYVIFTERNDTLRLVSARPITRWERQLYEEN